MRWRRRQRATPAALGGGHVHVNEQHTERCATQSPGVWPLVAWFVLIVPALTLKRVPSLMQPCMAQGSAVGSRAGAAAGSAAGGDAGAAMQLQVLYM